MFKRLWRNCRRLLFAGGVAAALVGGGPARADDRDDLRALKEQLELQKKQIEELQKKLEQMTQPAPKAEGDPATDLPAAPKTAAADRGAVEAMVADYLKRQDEEKKAKDASAKALAEQEGYKVGTDLKMGVRWNPLNGVTFETPNKDFVSHIGVRLHYDNVWWSQSANTRGLSQIGDLQDGTFFRRVRPSWDGQAWEVLEWNIELALEQTSNSVPTLDDAWAGIMKLPVVGAVRAGHFHLPQGLEGDMYSSSKAMTFMERSMFTDAFMQNIGTGVLATNSFLDQRLTYAFALYRQDNDNGINTPGNNAVDFNEGSYAYTGRLTALPIYENDGRHLLHLGASYTYRVSENPFGSSTATPPVQGGTGLAGPREAQFRARPQLRDAIGDYGNTTLTGNSKRIVDTGAIAAPSNQAISTELFYVLGPFSVQAEYAWATMDDAVSTGTTNTSRTLRRGTSLGSPWFDGGYVQLSYFLTGENRTYDRRYGRLASSYIASPYTPFWLTKGEDGNWLFGRGAWEVAARWNHLNLDNGLIQGGKSDALELGLNWYLNNNFKVQFEYLWQDRYHLKPGQVPGDINAFGIRTQFFF